MRARSSGFIARRSTITGSDGGAVAGTLEVALVTIVFDGVADVGATDVGSAAPGAGSSADPQLPISATAHITASPRPTATACRV
jgi:hypothetical protein